MTAVDAELYVLEPEPDACRDCCGSGRCQECAGSGVRPRVRRQNAYEALRKVVADAAAIARANGDTATADLLDDSIAGF